MLAGTLVALLMCLTTWSVASASPPMVPAYLALMVLIFVTPRSKRRLLALVRWSAKPVGDAEPNGDPKATIARVPEMAISRLSDQSVGDSTANELND